MDVVRLTMVSFGLAALLSGCASSPPPQCDGREQRALNPGMWSPPPEIEPASLDYKFYPSC